MIEHPRGQPIAAAAATSWLAVRSALPAGALQLDAAARIEGLGLEWVQLNPWSGDIAFARALDLLRTHVGRAYELAEAAP